MRDLIERLRDEAGEKSQMAWACRDGGQDCSLTSILAHEAADRIEFLETENADLRKERDEARAQALEEAADTAFVSARMGMTSEQIHAEICALKEKQG